MFGHLASSWTSYLKYRIKQSSKLFVLISIYAAIKSLWHMSESSNGQFMWPEWSLTISVLNRDGDDKYDK